MHIAHVFQKIRGFVSGLLIGMFLTSFVGGNTVFAAPVNDFQDTTIFFSHLLQVFESFFIHRQVPEIQNSDPSAVSGEGLSVSVDTSTIINTAAPRGATNITFMCWNFTADSVPRVITSLTIHHHGTGSTNDLSDLYLYGGVNRLTQGVAINSQTQTAQFNNINLSVDPGTATKLCLVGGFTLTALPADQHTFGFQSSDDIVTNAPKVNGDFPENGILTTTSG